MKTIIYNILTLCIISGCSSEKKESQNTDTTITLEAHDHSAHGTGNPGVAEVMAIHDSIMPQMGTLMNLKQKITADIKTTDSLLAGKANGILKRRKEEALTLQTQLEKADKEMMNWMHQYKADTIQKLDKEAAEAYIADQKQKIETVRDDMKKTISAARLFLQK